MARYRYAGSGPAEVWGVAGVRDGQLVRPGDVWEFPEAPEWGAWEPAGDDGPEAAETPPEDPGIQSPAEAADSLPAASTPPPAAQNGM